MSGQWPEATIDRRALLRGLVAGSLTAPVLAACSPARGPSTALHPALAPPPNSARVTVLDLPATGGRNAVLSLLRRLDGTEGVMVGFGASLFARVGVAQARPAALAIMPPFEGDVLDPAHTHGDLLLHVEGERSSDVRRRTENLLAGLTGGTGLRLRWRLDGHRAHNTLVGGRPLVRNPFGWTEGHGNAPAASPVAAAQVLIPAVSGQPAWTAGASLLSVRRVRLATALWNADTRSRQERVIGRHADGSWLDGRPATADPAFAADPGGALTPLDSHVRKVNPRLPGTPAPRMLRRSWAYADGRTVTGQPDEGILFMSYQADFETGFARAQRRLAGEAMARYLLAVGGGWFAVPARRPAAGWESIVPQG